MTVDPRAASGFADTAAAYERARPSYPPAAIAKVAQEVGVTTSSAVLDLAAGTGKLTRVLVPLAGHVIAVDPSELMLAQLREQLPGVEVRTGTAEAIPAPDSSIDAVFVGQAFHWFRSADVCPEIARVLSPGGGLVVMWNRARWDELPWEKEFHALVEPLREAAGTFPEDDWQLSLDRSGLFAPVSHVVAEHVHRIGPAELVDLVASFSWIANLPDEERTAVLGKVRSLVESQPQLALLYRTEIFWTHLA